MNLHAPFIVGGRIYERIDTSASRTTYYLTLRRFPRVAVSLPVGGLEACELSRRRFVATGHGAQHQLIL